MSSNFGTALPTSQAGHAVSFASNGNLQLGAGTSIYRNVAQIEAKCPHYTSICAVHSDMYLISYANQITLNSTLLVVQTSSGGTSETGVVKTVLDNKFFIYKTVALSTSTGLFVSICQGYSSTANTAYVVAGTVNSTTSKITLSAYPELFIEGYSIAPTIVALSETTFFIIYFTYDPVTFVSSTLVKFGEVNTGNGNSISLSSPYLFANQTDYLTFTATALTPTKVMMAYYYGEPLPYYAIGAGPVYARLVNIAATAGNAAAATITFSENMTLPDSLAQYYLAATALANDTAVVVYADSTNDYAIKAQAIKVLDQVDTSSGVPQLRE